MKAHELAAFVDKFEENPEVDIPEAFLEQLQLYGKYVSEYDIQTIAKQFSFIPKNVEKIVNNFYLCSELQICDLITNILFKFITVRSTSNQPAIWAANLLRKLSAQKEIIKSVGVRSKIALKAIKIYPKEYLKLLDNRALNILALSSPPDFIVVPLLEEMDSRDIEIPQNILNQVSFSDSVLSPQLVMSVFEFFITDPSLIFGDSIVAMLKMRPQLHMYIIRDLSAYNPDSVKYALSVLGESIINSLPFKFPLSYLYSPKIRDLVDEIEHSIRDPSQADKEMIASIIKGYSDKTILFIAPIIFEFPNWSSLLRSIDERLHRL